MLPRTRSTDSIEKAAGAGSESFVSSHSPENQPSQSLFDGPTHLHGSRQVTSTVCVLTCIHHDEVSDQVAASPLQPLKVGDVAVVHGGAEFGFNGHERLEQRAEQQPIANQSGGRVMSELVRDPCGKWNLQTVDDGHDIVGKTLAGNYGMSRITERVSRICARIAGPTFPRTRSTREGATARTC